MFLIEYAALFVIGTGIGSFLNVLIYRIPRGESIVLPGSHCPRCKRQIKPHENIPLISYVLLKGKCKGCGWSIPIRYPIVEALMGLLASALLLKFGFSWNLVFYGVLAALLLALSVIDIQVRRLPNQLVLAGVTAAVGMTLLFRHNDIVAMISGGALGLGLLLFNWLVGKMLFRKEGVGMGDIKLAGMTGLFLKPVGTALMFVIAVFSAALYGIALVVFGKKEMLNRIAFGPFLSLGALMTLFLGEELLIGVQQLFHWYFSVLRQ